MPEKRLSPESLCAQGPRRRAFEDVRPVAIDLCCGLGGWTKGFLAEGYRVIGFDVEPFPTYPGELVLQDIRTLDGRQLRSLNPAVIVASPPCQAYSYRAMPWKRARALPPPDNLIWEAVFRIAREAGCPIVVENVKGAQKWVGRAAWHYGSFYLWGDVPALMPPVLQLRSVSKNSGTQGGTWFNIAHGKRIPGDNAGSPVRGMNEYATAAGIKLQPEGHYRKPGSGRDWFDMGPASYGSNSPARKAASQAIAEIPFDLAQWIARCFKPVAEPVPVKRARLSSPGAKNPRMKPYLRRAE